MVHECISTMDDANQTVAIKKAIGASLFILYILYTLAAVVGEMRKDTQVSGQDLQGRSG